jgi:hypothetical protein
LPVPPTPPERMLKDAGGLTRRGSMINVHLSISIVLETWDVRLPPHGNQHPNCVNARFYLSGHH